MLLLEIRTAPEMPIPFPLCLPILVTSLPFPISFKTLAVMDSPRSGAAAFPLQLKELLCTSLCSSEGTPVALLLAPEQHRHPRS